MVEKYIHVYVSQRGEMDCDEVLAVPCNKCGVHASQ